MIWYTACLKETKIIGWRCFYILSEIGDSMWVGSAGGDSAQGTAACKHSVAIMSQYESIYNLVLALNPYNANTIVFDLQSSSPPARQTTVTICKSHDHAPPLSLEDKLRSKLSGSSPTKPWFSDYALMLSRPDLSFDSHCSWLSSASPFSSSRPNRDPLADRSYRHMTRHHLP